MIRSCLLGVIVAMLGCASQPICPPWSPTTTAAPAEASQTVQASDTNKTEMRESPEDGTVFLAGPNQDEEWTSVVGKGSPPRASFAPSPQPLHVEPAVSKTPKPSKRAASVSAKSHSETKQSVAATPKETRSANPANTALRAEARAIYAGRCVPCHGASGRGDGPAGAALNPHPRNFTDKAWQSSVNVAYLEKVISRGGPAVGKSPLMPAQADLAQNPELLRALAHYIQDFGR
ncbi:MAG: c-type cytochrome [Kofleriaceae bacterium]